MKKGRAKRVLRIVSNRENQQHRIVELYHIFTDNLLVVKFGAKLLFFMFVKLCHLAFFHTYL